jgi:hypothetical protein
LDYCHEGEKSEFGKDFGDKGWTFTLSVSLQEMLAFPRSFQLISINEPNCLANLLASVYGSSCFAVFTFNVNG